MIEQILMFLLHKFGTDIRYTHHFDIRASSLRSGPQERTARLAVIIHTSAFQYNIVASCACALATKKYVCLFCNCRGSDFRKDYDKLGVLCALFPDIPVVAMTATASCTDMKCIQESLGLKKCKVVANLDKKIYIMRKCFDMVKILMLSKLF